MTEGYWLRWVRAALVRALKTFAQTAVALLGAGAVSVIDVDWLGVAGISATAAVVSLLTSLAGLPEVGDDVPPLFEDSEVIVDDVDSEDNEGDDPDADGDGGR